MKKTLFLLIIFLFSIISLACAYTLNVEILEPTSGMWVNEHSNLSQTKENNTILITYKATGNDTLYNCTAYRNWNASARNWNTSSSDIFQAYGTIDNSKYYTTSNATSSNMWIDINETNSNGLKLNIGCININASVNARTTEILTFATSNHTILFDITYPNVLLGTNTLFQQRNMPPVNNISDRRPTLWWNSANDSNFYRYMIYLDDSSSFGSLDRTYYLETWNWRNYSYGAITNITNCNGTLIKSWSNHSLYDCLYANYSNFTIPTNLNFINYYWGINVSDLAGNENATYNNYKFTIDETCSILYAGWNLCGIVNEGGTSAWQIYQDTSVTQVSIINTTNHSLFTSWITTSSPNFTIEEGQSAFIYVETQTDWRTRVWNINNESRLSIYNFTNASGNGFDTFMIPHRSGLTFQQLDWYFSNSNGRTIGLTKGWFLGNLTSIIPYMSYFNNSASTSKKFTPYFHNVSWKNNTKIDYGEVIWVYTDNQSFSLNRSEFTYYS